jgi:hypothetical protein
MTATFGGARIADELHREFAAIPETFIRACVAQAIADLRGSISRESLPEMAVRLARMLLAARADARVGVRVGDFRPCDTREFGPMSGVGWARGLWC